jgi:hypothetical protein
MRLQRARRDEGVQEVVVGVVSHTETLHYLPRAVVDRRREGDDLRDTELAKAELQGGACTLGRVSAAPLDTR